MWLLIRQRSWIRRCWAVLPLICLAGVARAQEPCFTSALPGILKSLGYRNAALKNPDTCWGGYVRAFGGELINWVGPDGTGLPTVLRYAVEAGMAVNPVRIVPRM